MAVANKFNSTVNVLANGGIVFATDLFRIVLTNTPPVPTNAVYADVSGTELPGINGYVTGGNLAAFVSSGQLAGLYKLVLASASWIATGLMGPFQYAILVSMNTSFVTRPLVCWWALPAPLTLAPTQSFTVVLDPVTGTVQMQ
jgi:hypothetical protein